MRITALLVVAALTSSVVWAKQSSNEELAEITASDQADRRQGPDKIDWVVVNQRDEQRRERVLQILKDGNIRTDSDYQNAALVFQHGASAEDIRLAHALSQVALKMNPNNRLAAWLSAASWDRLMLRLGQPQWYATQFVKREGQWVLYEVNETVVTDEERLRVGARTLAAAREHAKQMNR